MKKKNLQGTKMRKGVNIPVQHKYISEKKSTEVEAKKRSEELNNSLCCVNYLQQKDVKQWFPENRTTIRFVSVITGILYIECGYDEIAEQPKVSSQFSTHKKYIYIWDSDKTATGLTDNPPVTSDNPGALWFPIKHRLWFWFHRIETKVNNSRYFMN